MRTPFRAALCVACTVACMPGVAQAQEAEAKDGTQDRVLTDFILVSGARPASPTADEIEPPRPMALPADTAAIAARIPGGALIGNGALSGQLSYRGMTGERVLGRVNGQRFASGGPNAMDPPLHYAPSVLVDSIEVARGVAPVSQGPSVAGAIDARLVQTQFSPGAGIDVQARVTTQYRTVDDSYAIGGLIGIVDSDWRVGIIASREQGDDYEFAGGTAAGTSFERNLYGVHAGFGVGDGEIFVEYRRSATDPTGNPPFALDIVYFDTDFVQGGFRGGIADGVELNLRLGHVAVRHLMDNQTTREPAAPPMNARATFADADTSTAAASLRFGSAMSYVEFGADAELVDKFVTITNPTNPDFFIDAQPDLQSHRYGAFVQWRESLGSAEFDLGVRVDDTRQSAGVPRLGSAVPIGPRRLAAEFVAADREHSATTVDAAMRIWLQLDGVTPRLNLARKQRVPSLLEKFGWLPTEASFGLADGNVYVGNLDLEPETAWIVEAGLDIERSDFSLRPTIYYRRVDDFIQGVPVDATIGIIDSTVEMVAAMNGDPTPLRFDNVDAEMFGADIDFIVRPTERLELEGTANVVRARRRDIDDDLYRIPPANMRLSATWTGRRLALGAELNVAAAQDHVSLSNDEEPSDGYAVLGLFTRYEAADGIAIEAGIENLLDAYYQPHLSGRNRVRASDVPFGERLPGAGRGAWVRLHGRF